MKKTKNIICVILFILNFIVIVTSFNIPVVAFIAGIFMIPLEVILICDMEFTDINEEINIVKESLEKNSIIRSLGFRIDFHYKKDRSIQDIFYKDKFLTSIKASCSYPEYIYINGLFYKNSEEPVEWLLINHNSLIMRLIKYKENPDLFIGEIDE